MSKRRNITTSRGQNIILPFVDGPIADALDNPTAMVDFLLKQINEDKIYDFFFRNKDHLTMLDIGANLGLVSLYASDRCHQIVALEPSPQFDVMKSICSTVPHIKPMKIALGPHNGTAEFMVNDINSTASSMSQTYGKAIQVPTVTLSRLLQTIDLWNVHFCKVDIEGSECECLTPLELHRCRPFIASYFVEVHNCPNSTWQSKMGVMTERFIFAGYSAIRIRGDSIFACIP